MELAEIKTMLDSASGQAMKDYLLLKLEELKSIDNLESTTVVEVKAQKKAYKKLREVLESIITFTAEIKSKDPRDSYQI